MYEIDIYLDGDVIKTWKVEGYSISYEGGVEKLEGLINGKYEFLLWVTGYWNYEIRKAE